MKTVIYTTALLLFLNLNVTAKRIAPKKVPAVETEKAVLSAPHFSGGERSQNGGFIEARDPKTKKLLWRVQVYKTVYDKKLLLFVYRERTD